MYTLTDDIIRMAVTCSYSLLYVIFVLFHLSVSEPMTACCCPGTCSFSLLNVSCPKNTTGVVAFQKLISYRLSLADACPRFPNSSAADLQSPLEEANLVMYTMAAFSGKPTPHNTTNLPSCNAIDRSVLVYEYTCINPDYLTPLCQRNTHQIPSKSVGIWTDSYPNVSTTLKTRTNCSCDVIVKMTSQIKVTLYDNTLNGSQTVKLRESGGNVLQQWNSTVHVGDIGKAVTLNLSNNTTNLTVEWTNPHLHEYGSVWIVLEAVQVTGNLQIYCQDPTMRDPFSVTTDITTCIGSTEVVTPSSTTNDALSANISTKSDSGSLWYVWLIFGVMCTTMAIVPVIVWRLKCRGNRRVEVERQTSKPENVLSKPSPPEQANLTGKNKQMP